MSRQTQRSSVLQHLRTNKSITSVEAFEQYGATRLAAIIFDLRKQYQIDTVMMDGVNRFGGAVRYAKYVLREDE